MIAVVADDLSGAAEVAAAAVAHGLSAEVQLPPPTPTDAEVVVVDTDSRSCPDAAAAARVAEVGRQLALATWIYKKTDSVLRGPVWAELRALMTATGQPRALLVPANPGYRRTVSGGRIYVDGRPLDQGPFALDPEHPARSADVRQLLRAGPGDALHLLPVGGSLPASGLAVGDADCTDHLLAWARLVQSGTLPAGGVEFFHALLGVKGHRLRSLTPPPPERPALLVCGSAASWEPTRRRQCEAAGVPIVTLPPALFAATVPATAVDDLATALARALASAGVAVAAVGTGQPAGPPRLLAARLAAAVAQAVRLQPVRSLRVEGGATAAELVRQTGWRRLRATSTGAGGIVGFRPLPAADPVLFIKPGSYPWPAPLWPLGPGCDAVVPPKEFTP